MRAVLQLVLIGSVATLAGARPLRAQKRFEGTIAYQIETGGREILLTLSARGKKLRRDMEMPGTSVISRGTYQIIDFDRDNVITVVPAMKRYMVIDQPAHRDEESTTRGARDSARDQALARLTATGRREAVAGVGCEVYVMKDLPGDEWCITNALGYLRGFEPGGGAGARGRSPIGNTELPSLPQSLRSGAVVLRMRTTGPDGRDITMAATKIDRTTPPARYFTVPAGFAEMQNPMGPRP